MKKIVIALLLSIPIWVGAQSPLNDFYDKYSGKDGYTSVYITKYMFDIFAKISNEADEDDVIKTLSKLDAIKILTVDSATHVHDNFSFSKELKRMLPRDMYKELMIVKDGDETITFMIREAGNKISEFVMTVEGSSSPVLIFLEGKIDLDDISKLSKSMDINGMEYLEKVKDK